MKHDDEAPDLYEEFERRALFGLTEDDEEASPPDLIGSLSGVDAGAEADRDVTLGGYIDKHDRVPAFEGSDAQPYTVDIDVEPTAAGGFTAFLIFIRWAATGAGIMDHLESGDIAVGETAQEARRGALDLSLYEIKAELDAAIERRRLALED
ncbi:MAG TPA: hypothetical protein VMN60_12660 [Longimicrobiales bacterium]|nr:hypothetical protein [Longimicrobiales bacterium]